MRAVVQRVSRGAVAIDGEKISEIGKGFVILLGVSKEDSEADLAYLVDKISGLRVFEDENSKMNLSLTDVGGAALVVSQFTLYGDCRRGKRPSFSTSAPAEVARDLYEKFIIALRAKGIEVKTGVFQADMEVSIINDGPVTIMLDSSKLF